MRSLQELCEDAAALQFILDHCWDDYLFGFIAHITQNDPNFHHEIVHDSMLQPGVAQARRLLRAAQGAVINPVQRTTYRDLRNLQFTSVKEVMLRNENEALKKTVKALEDQLNAGKVARPTWSEGDFEGVVVK